MRDPKRVVLMGDPAHFRVQGGANPHTRTRWGTRRRVDRAPAVPRRHEHRVTRPRGEEDLLDAAAHRKPPARIGDRDYADGGLRAVLPLDVAGRFNPDLVAP